MKILTIGNFEHGWDGSICDEEHIAGALEELGHEVERHQRDGLIIPFKKTGDYDFTLIAQWDGYSEDFIDHLPRPLVYWAFDHQDPNQDWHRRLVLASDLYLSKRMDDGQLFPDSRWAWLSQDFSPPFLHPAKEMFTKDIDVLFTGSWVPWESGRARVEILKEVEKHFNLHIYGVTGDQWRAEGFKNVHGPVMDRELPALIARAKINFSMDHVWSAGYWSDRNAQIMNCGGFVLFRHVPFSEATFRDYIAYFYNAKTCLQSVEYWLQNDEDREHLAKAGQEYANLNLRVNSRVADLLTIVQEVL